MAELQEKQILNEEYPFQRLYEMSAEDLDRTIAEMRSAAEARWHIRLLRDVAGAQLQHADALQAYRDEKFEKEMT